METAAVDATLLRRLCEPFEQAVGLPLEFHAPGEFCIRECATAPAFCRVMAQGLRASQRCLEFHLELEGAEPQTGQCFAGLTSTAIPVHQGRTLMGYLHTGHAYVDRQPGCARPGKTCYLPGRREAGWACAGACRETPQAGAARYQAAVALAGMVAERLGALHAPPAQGKPFPAIDHIVRMIRADVSKPWRLAALARQAGMHPSYFSEKFRRRTGRSLTAFLAEMRVARARELLSFTALPIGEIAFASGFRSLSQFNRVFRAVSGSAPSDHRKEPARPHAPKQGA